MIKTKPEEFEKFHNALMNNCPNGYVPWYFPVAKENKNPDGIAVAKRSPAKIPKGVKRGNWKAAWARLTYEEALERLKQGFNVGISGRAYDDLIIIDIDDYNYKFAVPNTLTIKSRKRCGWHSFCWKKKECTKLPLNIPTEHGEIRSSDQYVVAAGSYVPTSENDIEKENIPIKLKEEIKQDENLGVYTVENYKELIHISYDELPKFFQETHKKQNEVPKMKAKTIKPTGKHSALFDLKISDIVAIQPNRREPHPLHASDTGANFSISDDGELAHCWRHFVSLNAIQFLVVKQGYMSCEDAGSGHKGNNYSKVTGDDGAIFWAWYQAKKDGLIPKDDPMPTKAMKYIAKKHKLIDKEYEMLPIEIYNKVIEIIEKEYR